jgi:hypothetical protein
MLHSLNWVSSPNCAPLKGMKSIASKAQSFAVTLQGKVRDSVGSGLAELKGTVLEAMAKRMTEKDKDLLLKNWGQVPLTDVVETSHRETPVPGSASREKILPSADLQEALRNASSRTECIFHPILGERIAQLQYKSLYLTNVRSLAHAPVWKKQRILRPERAQMIVQDKIRNRLTKSLSGTISFYKDENSGEIGIIDGQHRVGALLLLAQKGMRCLVRFGQQHASLRCLAL